MGNFKQTPSSGRNTLVQSVRDGLTPFGLPHHSNVTGPRAYLGVGVQGGEWMVWHPPPPTTPPPKVMPGC